MTITSLGDLIYCLYLEIEEIKERDRRKFQMEDRKKGKAIYLVVVLEDTRVIQYFKVYLFLLHLSLPAI